MSNEVFVPIPEELSFIRTILKTGSWAILTGNSNAARGNKLPAFCKDLGLQKLDIIWVNDEKMPSRDLRIFNLKSNKLKLKDFEECKKFDNYLDKDLLRKYDNLMNRYDERYNSIQRTILDARLNKSKTVRFYCGELSIISKKDIKEIIEAYITIPLAMNGREITDNVIVGDTIKDLIGALQLDGMSKEEAICQVVEWEESTWEELDSIIAKPNHYFKLKEEYVNVFGTS